MAAADQALERATQGAASAAPKQAAEAYLAVRRAYPESTAGQEALFEAGILFFEAKDYVAARKALNELLFEDPLFPKADEAKLKLGLSSLEVGAYRDAYQSLLSLSDHLEG